MILPESLKENERERHEDRERIKFCNRCRERTCTQRRASNKAGETLTERLNLMFHK